MLGYQMVGTNHLNKRPVRIQKASKHWQPFENRTLKTKQLSTIWMWGLKFQMGLDFGWSNIQKPIFFDTVLDFTLQILALNVRYSDAVWFGVFRFFAPTVQD